jgi:hypothetical protein
MSFITWLYRLRKEGISMSEREYIRIREKFASEEIDVIYYRSTPLDAPLETPLPGCGVYPPLSSRTYVESGIRVDQDVAVKLRDGVTIYVDVYRPAGSTGEKDVPAILSWSYYGKRSNPPGEHAMTLGVPPGTLSNMCMFEGPDPLTGAGTATPSSAWTAGAWAIPRAISPGSVSRTARTAT